jgi:hypothetical protein
MKLAETARTRQGGITLPAAESKLPLSHFPGWPKHGRAAFCPFIVSLANITLPGGRWRRASEYESYPRRGRVSGESPMTLPFE